MTRRELLGWQAKRVETTVTSPQEEWDDFNHHARFAVVWLAFCAVQFLPHYTRWNILAAELGGASVGIFIFKAWGHLQTYHFLKKEIERKIAASEVDSDPISDKELSELKKITGME